MKWSSVAAVVVSLLASVGVVACDQLAHEPQAGSAAVAAPASAPSPAVAPTAASAKSPTWWRQVHNDDEVRSSIADFKATTAVKAATSTPVEHMVAPAGISCAPTDYDCIPVFDYSQTFVSICRGGPNVLFQGCTTPGCIVTNIWYGNNFGGQLPGTDAGLFLSGMTLMDGGFTSVDNIPPSTCVTASGSSTWQGETDDDGWISNQFLFPDITLASVYYSTTTPYTQMDPNVVNWGSAAAYWNNAPAFSQLTQSSNSMLDPNAIFEFVVTLVVADPGVGPYQPLYFEVSYDWDYNTASSPGY